MCNAANTLHQLFGRALTSANISLPSSPPGRAEVTLALPLFSYSTVQNSTVQYSTGQYNPYSRVLKLMVAGGRGHCIFIDHQEIEVESKILNIAHTQCVAKLNCDAQSQIILNMFSYYFVI